MLTLHEDNEAHHVAECGTLEDAEHVAFALIQTNGGKVVIRDLQGAIRSVLELGDTSNL